MNKLSPKSTESTSPRGDPYVSSVAHWKSIGWRLKLAIGVLALAGAGLVLLSTAKYGAGISPDSVWYFDVARSLMAGKGLIAHGGEPLVAWAPLYPMMLALIGFATGLDPAVFAPLVNAASFALVIILSALLFLADPKRPRILGLLGLCAVLFSITFSTVYAMAWSESLALPLWLLYFVAAQRYWENRGKWSLSVMTLAVALACVSKYLAVALVPAGVLTIILASGLKFRKRVVRACVFAALSLLPIGIWLASLLQRHYLGAAVDLHPSRTLQEFWMAWDGHVVSCAGVVFLWYLPKQAWFIVPAGFVVGAAATIFSRPARSRLLSSIKAILRHYSPAVILLVTYVLVLVSALAARKGVVEERYLSTVYIPVTLILVELAVRLFRPAGALPSFKARRGLAAIMVLWLCFPLTTVVLETAGRFRNGAGFFNTKKWHESETVSSARQLLSGINTDAHVYSNVPDALWMLLGVNATMSPRRTACDLTELKGHWPADSGSFLVWLDKRVRRTYLFSIEELMEVSNLEEVARLSDGSIYRVSVRETTAQDSSP